jgi:acetyltransferase-like isoleucine patch superfamily enzyme
MSEGWYTRDELETMGFKKLGENVQISRKACIYGAKNMEIGSHVRIDDFCMLVGNISLGSYIHIAPFVGLHGTGGGKVVLKDFAGISAQCSVYAGSDDYGGDYLTNPTVPAQFLHEISSEIVLEKHSILGLNCVLLPGAYVAEGCAIGAMSMLAKKTEPWGIYLGIPCKRVKERSKKLLELERELLGSQAETGENK